MFTTLAFSLMTVLLLLGVITDGLCGRFQKALTDTGRTPHRTSDHFTKLSSRPLRMAANISKKPLGVSRVQSRAPPAIFGRSIQTTQANDTTSSDSMPSAC
jgi:hypothetical protein